MIAVRALDVGSPVMVWVAAAMLVLIWSAIDGLAIDPDLGRYLVAAGWFLHGLWDFVYLRLDKVVARSYAEWCGVFDILVAAQLVLLA